MRASCALILTAALLAGCGGGGATTATTARTRTETTPRLTAAQRAALERKRAAQRPRFAGPVAAPGRPALVRAMRRSILRDARARARRHAIKGPILDVSCNVVADDRPYVRAHPDAPVVRYRCIAVNFRANTDPPTELGSPFVARVDFAARRYAWCLFTPVGGEGAHTSSTFDVPPSPACTSRR